MSSTFRKKYSLAGIFRSKCCSVMFFERLSKWGSECYGVDRRCGVAEVKGATELHGSAELGGVAELSGGPELGWRSRVRWRSGVGVEVQS